MTNKAIQRIFEYSFVFILIGVVLCLSPLPPDMPILTIRLWAPGIIFFGVVGFVFGIGVWIFDSLDRR